MAATLKKESNWLDVLGKALGIALLLGLFWIFDYLDRGGSWLVGGIFIACIIAGFVVLYFGLNYLDSRKHGSAISYQNRPFPGSIPMAPVPAHNVYASATRQCRYCEGFLTGGSPICPRCGRRN